jgi:hypothetical protein
VPSVVLLRLEPLTLRAEVLERKINAQSIKQTVRFVIKRFILLILLSQLLAVFLQLIGIEYNQELFQSMS